MRVLSEPTHKVCHFKFGDSSLDFSLLCGIFPAVRQYEIIRRAQFQNRGRPA